MPYAVLSEETRKQLEQERDRLMSDRDRIMSEMMSLISAEVDQTIQTLNALLNGSSEVNVAVLEPSESAIAQLDDVASSTQQKTPRRTGTKKTNAKDKERLPVLAFNAKQLKSNFKGLGVVEAVVQLMQQNSEQVYELDDLITALYEKFDESDLSKARKTLGVTLMHAARKGTIDQVGKKPSRYKLG
ncbi:hypothetical protein ACQ4M3_13085 [Leptolyngbya sp. AN03gr2]|uniref:hypothetical protein n=1 Tax=unclassified Leptolyngbya TaxID=2650499 RepID=UPI003D31E73A